MNLFHQALEGHGVSLLPTQVEDAEALAGVAEMDFFRYFVSLQPRSLETFGEFLEDVQAAPATLPYTLWVDGEAAGMSCYLDIRPEHRGVEIGMTWIARKWQGTHVNPAAKLLLLDHAFASGAVRVQLKMDSRNEHSRRAVQKLGATFEGVLRKHMIQPNGHIRDTVMFSILEDEWPGVRERLAARLGPRS